ncbi:putative ABI family protein [Helianthus annuus]|uniref:protein ABIL2 isoform X1 n=1 Tax=Helianthus annuus TaxID=4232 RepID=UPI000B90701B|nr:protein ABIL2 isoform X1 [Helianthus annuus]KAJ0570088.1 putative ABI family protein [Helianthus annuus]KAJ0584420.1 putative ABI family protein [Helianthus annuus]KAJ0789050.1 putative ABI family protein [Helianthus annuus]KAJ0918782.1 putative ABI family protein [Helianthus annuus]
MNVSNPHNQEMETQTSSAETALPDPTNYDETAMQQSLHFADNLKDLKNLRKQLYAAAEYFELSYTNDDQKQLVVDTIKDYAIKAIVNTVDHLGAVSCKLNDLLGQKVNEVSQTELHVSCIQQRLGICQRCFDHEGLAEQSSLINTPKYHKRYILPVGETMKGGIRTKSMYQGCSLEDEDDWHKFKNAVRATIREKTPSSFRKGRSPSPTRQPGSFAFAGAVIQNGLDKRSVSPLRFPLLRTESLSSRSTTPTSRPKTPNPSRPSSVGRQRVSGYQKSASMHVYSDRDAYKETDQTPSKSKRLLKALLSRRKSKKDDTLYTYLDEY